MMTMDNISMIAPTPFAPFRKGCPPHLLLIEKDHVPIGPSQHKQETGKKQSPIINSKSETVGSEFGEPATRQEEQQAAAVVGQVVVEGGLDSSRCWRAEQSRGR